ncbi:MAG: Uma2 family endonuclease [Leptolyngbyaceae cyanobacterium MO_188.B28]|nr:Uma2 family endonuclease [Leptolyngbyaceae cyanobacterium MO_188.B28]
MTQAKPRYPTVDDYLDDKTSNFERVEYCDGELIPLMAESGENDYIAISLQFYLATRGFFPLQLVRAHSCELQVEKFHKDDHQTRLPDLVILRPEHIELTRRRLSIRFAHPAPLLVAEVVSPYNSTKERSYQEDYIQRPYQYAMRGIPEYWIIDPQSQVVIVRSNPGASGYAKFQEFRDNDLVRSQLPELAGLQLTARQILEPQI